nr:PREDICTED: protein phosphatase 1L-like [Bemisia tabaci]
MDVDVSKIIVDENRGGWLAAVETHKKEERTNNVGVYAVKGTERRQIEDTHKFYENPLNIKASFFGVFDGHSGAYASGYAADVMMKALVRNVAAVKKLIGDSTPTRSGALTKDNQPQETEQPPPETERKTNLKTERLRTYLGAEGVINYGRLLTDVILMVDEALCDEFLLKPAGVPPSVGSSVLIAVLEGSQLTVANVGDSRGVMCDSDGLPVALSFDQKPSRPDEKRRIQKAGGTVVYAMGAYRLDGYLALSRAIGPHPGKKEKHLIANPEVITFDLSDYKPQFLVLATDGLYDVLSSADVVAFLLTRLHEPDFGARSLVQLALLMRSTDDITVMVINLKDQKLPEPKRARRVGFFKHRATSFARKHLPSGKKTPSTKKSPSSKKLPPSEKSPSRISVPPPSPPPSEESSKVPTKQ